MRWRATDVAGEPRLHVLWEETGIEAVAARKEARRVGFGRELIERALPDALGADTSYALEPDRLRCTIEVPVSWEGERLAPT